MNKIIIAEDDPVAAKVLNIILKQKDVEVTQVESGNALLHKIAEKHFDLALVDYRLPDVEGLELLQQLQQHYKDLPVIIQSAHVTDDLDRQLKNAGAADIIEKPINKNTLHELLDKHLA